MAWLVCGTIPDPSLRERFTKDFDTGMLSPFAIAAMVAAYEEGEEWLAIRPDSFSVNLVLQKKIIIEFILL